MLVLIFDLSEQLSTSIAEESHPLCEQPAPQDHHLLCGGIQVLEFLDFGYEAGSISITVPGAAEYILFHPASGALVFIDLLFLHIKNMCIVISLYYFSVLLAASLLEGGKHDIF